MIIKIPFFKITIKNIITKLIVMTSIVMFLIIIGLYEKNLITMGDLIHNTIIIIILGFGGYGMFYFPHTKPGLKIQYLSNRDENDTN